MNAETDAAELLDRVRAQREAVLLAQREVEALRVPGSSPYHEVTVTVLGTGEVAEVEFGPGVVESADAITLGSLVRSAVNDGVRQLKEASRQRFQEVLDASRQLL
ncbi:MAG TPA: YbaB/EbfC family nucleoid-associated protein [Pseudonocardiaceae bacterium]|jgi:DNA-binding protein YbaB|nr:YbaB/EbfC family nucleoid-associated protein [Pseudonocardiaceae bacterium]